MDKTGWLGMGGFAKPEKPRIKRAFGTWCCFRRTGPSGWGESPRIAFLMYQLNGNPRNL